jgi:hypothetical protein
MDLIPLMTGVKPATIPSLRYCCTIGVFALEQINMNAFPSSFKMLVDSIPIKSGGTVAVDFSVVFGPR